MRPLRNLTSRLSSRQCIDDATQQYWLGKLCGREGNIGYRQPPGQRSLGAEQSKNAPIELKNIHARRKLSQTNVIRVVPGARRINAYSWVATARVCHSLLLT